MKHIFKIVFSDIKLIPFSGAFLLLLLAISCARMSSPGGGAKDEDPPVALKSKPVNYSTNFNEKKILVEFDEFIVLKNIRQELLVSPPLPEKTEIKQRGKTMMIKINNELKDSTTYNFNFYNAIVDLNEGNLLKNFQFEFSTGSEFDSIYIGGTIRDAFNLSTEAGWFLMLYENFHDSIPRTTLPNYIAKTDEDGHFILSNLKNKPYYIFALKDMNNNMLFDLPNENIAFIDTFFSPGFEEHTFVDTFKIIKSISDDRKDTVRIDSLVSHKHMITTVGDINLFLFVENFEQQYFVQSYRPESQQIIFSFNKELNDSISIIPLLNGESFNNWYLQEKFESNDSLVYWITDSSIYKTDSLNFQVNYTMKDSSLNDYIQTDTILVRYKAPKKNSDKSERKKKKKNKINLNFLNAEGEEDTKKDSVIPPSELTFKHNAKTPFELNKPVEFESRFPIKQMNESQIKFSRIEDDTVKIPIEFEIIQKDLVFRYFDLNFEKDDDETFELFIPAGAITDIYGNINDTLKYRFKTRALEYYSTILMQIIGVKEPSIVQLLNAKEKIIEQREIYTDTTLLYNYLVPSKYKFKLYYDSNKNGKWDTGNYKELKQPEKVFYYPFLPEVLETKSNMDFENKWELHPKDEDILDKPLLKN